MCTMRPFGRHRKLLRIILPSALLLVIYVTNNGRTTRHENVRCINGLCENPTNVVEQRITRKIQLTTTSNTNLSLPNDNTLPIVTQALHPDIVVYNRVPKCASSTVRYLIKKLEIRNRFTYKIHNWPNVKQSLTKQEENDLVKEVVSYDKPVLFLRHLHYVDFTKYNVTKPAYVNVIRNPVDRFVSHYYFSRYGFEGWTEEKIKKWLWSIPEERRNMSIDDCVATLGAERCVRDNKENMMDFFCGQDKRCRTHDDWALDKAMENIANNFVFIGILERLDDSFKVAEAVLPRYFDGAVELYKRSPNGARHTRTARKKEPSEETRRLLTEALHREMNLYNFVKKRFEIQFNALKSKGAIT